MSERPKYSLVRQEIVLVCDTPEAEACCELALSKDAGGGRESEWWGHPSTSCLPNGTLVLRAPANAWNILKMHECGAAASDNAPTQRRLDRLRTSPKAFDSDAPLRPFQLQGVSWLLGRDLSAILAFEPGLGKTLTSLAAMKTDPAGHFPCVVFAPAHVKLNWLEEWKKWGGDEREAVVLFGRKPEAAAIAGRKLIVLNHHILAAWADVLCAEAPKTVLIDEAHNFVNSNTKTYPIVERVVRAAGCRVLMLTATPLVNDLGDLWGLCNLISPDILGGKTVFTDTFMPEEREKARLLASRWRGGFQQGAWKDVQKHRLPKALKERRVSELAQILKRTVILCKKRAEVEDQLPAVTETRIRIDIPEDTPDGKKFWEVERDCASDIAEGKEDVLASDRMLGAYSRAKRNTAFAKLPDAEEWIRDFLAESDAAEKLVVVGWSVEPLEKLHEKFKKESVLVNGSLDAAKKHAAGKLFASEPGKRILFGNMKSIGTGIDTLVAARTMFFVELPLTAMELEQLKGRIDRLSQTAKALSYYYMTVRDTIEEKHGWGLINRKQKLTTALGL